MRRFVLRPLAWLTFTAWTALLPVIIFSQDSLPPPVPADVGLFYLQEGKLEHVEGRAAVFGHSGPLLSNAIAEENSKKWKVAAQIPGSRSEVVMGASPSFYYHAPGGPDSAATLMLVKLTAKGRWRVFDIAREESEKTANGISVKSQLEFKKTEISPGFFLIRPSATLARGQYAFYHFRGLDLPGFVYDFMVE